MRIIAFLLTGIFLTACTQQAARVENKGAMFFSKDGSARRYSDYAPAAGGNHYSSAPPRVISYGTTTEDNAPLSSVSSRDLDAPAEKKTTPSLQKTAPRSQAEPTRNIWQSNQKDSASASGFIEPVQGKVISAYGARNHAGNDDGITYSAPLGEPVFASADGEVAYVGDQIKTHGNMIIIKHENRLNTSYSHLGSTVVSKGARVSQGQIIGYVGQSGDAAKPQLHFVVRKGRELVNPSDYLIKEQALRQ